MVLIEDSQSEGHKPNKIRVDKGSEFYNSSFKKWLKDNNIEIDCAVAERFIKL